MARPSKTTPENESTVQVTFRIPEKWLTRADHVAKRLSKNGVELSRTDGYRLAMQAGFEKLERRAVR